MISRVTDARFGTATHLNSNDLDRLVPSSKSASNSGSKDLVHSAELLAFLDALDASQRRLGKTSETETRSPVCGLTNGDSVDTLVDTSNTFTSVDIHEDFKSRSWWASGLDCLVSSDLNSLHARAETWHQ